MMDIPPGEFKIGDAEDVYLSGSYDLKIIPNKVIVPDEVDSNIKCQVIYDVGKVLYRSDTESIFDLIDVFIRYTHDPCTDLDLDFSIKEEEQMRYGTICPTKKILFTHCGKNFVAFGRYIFGYDNFGREVLKRNKPIEVDKDSDISQDEDDSSGTEEEEEKVDEVIKRKKAIEVDWDSDISEEEDEDDCSEDEEEEEKTDLININKIVLWGPEDSERRNPCGDHYYSFMIYDKETNVLDAFGLYW